MKRIAELPPLEEVAPGVGLPPAVRAPADGVGEAAVLLAPFEGVVGEDPGGGDATPSATLP